MLANLLLWLVLIVLAFLFSWLTLRIFRSGKRIWKWLGVGLGGLLTLLLVLVIVTSGIGLYKLYAHQSVQAPTLEVAGTPEQIARGGHIASMYCVSCHTLNKQLPLSGGKDIGAESPVPIGSLIPFNLTPSGPLQGWSDGDIFRALRYGIDPQSRPLVAMSNLSTRFLSDEDIQSVIAYLRSQPPVPRATREGDYPNLLFALFVGANLVPAPEPAPGVVTAPSKAPTAEYGQYIVKFMGCRDCHGAYLAGGKSGGLNPAGPSLRVVDGWTRDQFLTTIRTGTDPGGHHISLEHMAWDIYAHMDDDELGAVYAYLTSLPVAQK